LCLIYFFSLFKNNSICAQLYHALVAYYIPQAIYLTNQEKYELTSEYLFFDRREIGICNKNFSGSTNLPLGERSSIIQKLIDIALAILKQLLNG